MKNFFKLIGKKKSLSAFTEMNPSALVGGVQTRGGVVADIEADILIEYPDDIFSTPDSNGRRWVYLASALDSKNEDKARIMVSQLRLDILGKYAGVDTSFYDAQSEINEIKDMWKNAPTKVFSFLVKSGVEDAQKEANKIKGKMVGEYIDGLEAIMKKFAKDVESNLRDFGYGKDNNPESWDELVVNNFKVNDSNAMIDKIASCDKLINNKLNQKEVENLAKFLYNIQAELAMKAWEKLTAAGIQEGAETVKKFWRVEVAPGVNFGGYIAQIVGEEADGEPG